MSKFQNPVIPYNGFVANETEVVRIVDEATDMTMASSVNARVDKTSHATRSTGGSVSPRTRQLQVRDNAQRTRFVLVWSDIDGTVSPAINLTFHTIRDAMTEGVTRFGVLPIRWR